MKKARELYIWLGDDTITITKGHQLEKYETHRGMFYKGEMKHRGVFNSYFPIQNIPEVCLSSPRKLFVKNRALEGWRAFVINVDYVSQDRYISDLPPQLVVGYENLSKELKTWKLRCFQAEEKLLDMENKDKFDERMKEKLKFASEARQISSGISEFGGYGMGGMGYGGYGGYPGFGSRWLGSSIPPVQTQTPNE